MGAAYVTVLDLSRDVPIPATTEVKLSLSEIAIVMPDSVCYTGFRCKGGMEMTGWWFAPAVALGLTAWAMIAMMVV